MRIPENSTEISRRKILNAFPADLSSDVEKVIEYLLDKKFDVHPTVEQSIILNGESLSIPCRVYFDKPHETTGKRLTELQQNILNCLYLRHHNGYIRQARLELLMGKTDYFIVPYVFQLLGEYVKEILPLIDNYIDERTIELFVKFILENPKYWQQTECRMISYWNEYYRREFRNLHQYIGYKIVKKLKMQIPPASASF